MSTPLRIDFIVGMSRTGITWLTRALNLHPELTTFGQSRFWGKHFREPAAPRGYDASELRRMHQRLRGFTWDGTVGHGPGCLEHGLEDMRALIDEAWARLVPPASPAQAFGALAGAFARAGQTAHVLEKTPHHVLHVARIRAHLPRARFVIIEAGPEDYAAIQRGQRDLRHHPIAVALLFRRYRAACDHAARVLGRDAVRVELRALADDPDRTLAPVFDLLEVEPISVATTMPPLAHAVPEPFAGPPPPVDRLWLERLAGTPRHGATRSRPSLADLIGSLATLPTWALHNLRMNLVDVEGSLVDYYARWLRRP